MLFDRVEHAVGAHRVAHGDADALDAARQLGGEVGRQVPDRLVVLARDEQRVAGEQRPGVEEAEPALVLVDDVGRRAPGDDLAEDAGLRGHSARRPASARPSVTSSAYSRSPPTGRPDASRVTVTCGERSRRPSAMNSAVASPVVVGFVARTTSRIGSLGRLDDARVELGDLQVLGVDAVDRRQRAAEHVVAPAVLVRALDRDDVAGLLDDADQARVAPLVLADPAARLVGEVEAHLAQADALLDLADRVGERVGVLGRGAQDVERQPLRGALPDARQLAELGDEALDGRGVQGWALALLLRAAGGAVRRAAGQRPPGRRAAAEAAEAAAEAERLERAGRVEAAAGHALHLLRRDLLGLA